MNKISPEPECLLLLGLPGVGKTKITQDYEAQFAAQRSGKITSRPVLRISVGTPAHESDLATNILRTFGDPRAQRDSTGARTQRAIGFMQDFQVEMIIFDDIQHFVDRRDSNALPAVSNWLKILIKDTNVACVLVGLQDQAERVVTGNIQLAALFGASCIVEPFQWAYLDSDIKKVTDFQKFLRKLEGLLPFNEPSGLFERELAWRCFVASDGILRPLMKLIRRASYLALIQRRESLTQELLATAFQEELSLLQAGLPNPFQGDLPDRKKKYQNTEEDIPGATNNRSHAQQPPKERMQDIL